jgi:hypothetical protein
MVTLNLRKKFREMKIPFGSAEAALRASAGLLDDHNIQLHDIVDDKGKVIIGSADIRQIVIEMGIYQPSEDKKKGKKR